MLRTEPDKPDKDGKIRHKTVAAVDKKRKKLIRGDITVPERTPAGVTEPNRRAVIPDEAVCAPKELPNAEAAF